MKKLLVGLLSISSIFCVVIGLTACNKQDNNKATSSVALTAAQKENLYEGTYGEEANSNGGTYYGVGRTLNVITDDYITISSGYSKVFNAEKLLALNWRKTFTGTMDTTTISGSSMKEYYSKLNTQFNNNFSVGVGVNSFSANVGNKFGFSTGVNYVNTANEIYYTASQVYAASLVEIDEYYNLAQFEKVLSNTVLEDAKKIQEGAMTAASFIYKYGTHVVLAGYYGGRIDYNYYLRNLKEQWELNTAVNYENNINLSIGKLLTVQNGLDFSIQEDLGLTSEEALERFTAKSIGGVNFSALSTNDFLSHYNEWVDSMNEQTDYSNIVGLPQRSLAAIWDLFPSEYLEAKQILSAHFNEQAQSVSSEFLAKYERHYTEPIDEPEVNGDFAGGYGTVANPYLISNKEQFLNIKEYDNTNTYFKLCNSIDLGVWNSPFAFSGKFDGCGHQVNFYQTIKTKGNYMGGLFTVLNDASVSNILLNVNISRELDRSDIGKVGGLAGKTSGVTNISRVYVSGVINIGNYSGYDFVGGIVGQYLGGTIEECASSAKVTNYARNARTGGIVGYASPSEYAIKIMNCYNVGDLKSSSNWTAAFGGRSSGGIVGQVRGHNSFNLDIINCYNDSSVKLEWTGVATGGWQGCGGIYGDIENGVGSNINVTNSCWNSKKCSIYGNNAKGHSKGSKTDMSGIYKDWSSDIWQFSNEFAPRLKWMNK